MTNSEELFLKASMALREASIAKSRKSVHEIAYNLAFVKMFNEQPSSGVSQIPKLKKKYRFR